MTSTPSPQNKTLFFVIWFGQFISIIGSGLTGFALGVELFQSTGRATDFILITAFTVVPGILLSPIAGTVVDRYNRRTIMLISDIVAGVSTLIIVLAIAMGELQIWHIYLVTAINSSANTFQSPAYSALIAQVIPSHQLPRANSLVSLGESISGISAPIIAGFLVATFGIEAVLLLDFVTFIFAVGSLLVIRVPDVAVTHEEHTDESFWRNFKVGWAYIYQRPPLRALLTFSVVLSIIAIPELLVTPLILSFASEHELGIVLGFAGLGFMLGSLVMSIWGGPKRVIWGAVGIEIITGMATILMGFQPSIPLIGFALFVHYFTFAVGAPSNMTIWQRKVPQALHGRVLTTQKLVSWLALPISLLLAGPLVDNIFEPFMRSSDALAVQIGSVIGMGDGRGIALIMLISGSLNILLAVVAMSYKPLRHIEQILPDQNKH